MEDQERDHSAEAAALGFYYQVFFALLTLLSQDTDDAAVGIEQLDDVVLKADGRDLLYQLKHSLLASPPSITIKSRALWRTVKVWVDALPLLNLSETTLHLVSVAKIPDDSPLVALTSLQADRTALVAAMVDEARRVIDERAAASKARRTLPHSDRYVACTAFLALSDTVRANLLRRSLIAQGSPSIDKIEDLVADQLGLLPPGQRPEVAGRLIQWWDRQMVYSLCGKRERVVTRAELQQQISAIIGDIEQGRILPEFETVNPPDDYQPDGMLTRQIRLVEGTSSDLSRAIREEWRAREQRSKWMNERLSMASEIGDYDLVLVEHWSDRHSQMTEECAKLANTEKCAAGLKILRWTHEIAPNTIRPVTNGWNAAYYVRGSYQILAIALRIGWHPDFATLLGDDQ